MNRILLILVLVLFAGSALSCAKKDNPSPIIVINQELGGDSHTQTMPPYSIEAPFICEVIPSEGSLSIVSKSGSKSASIRIMNLDTGAQEDHSVVVSSVPVIIPVGPSGHYAIEISMDGRLYKGEFRL